MTLIHKDLKGQSDLPGMTALKAMHDVGSEFMTSDDGSNPVQKSGEFVEMTHRGDDRLRMLAVCEPANNRDTEGVLFDDDPAPEPGDGNFVPRTFVIKAGSGPSGEDEPMQRRPMPAWRFRLPRYTLVEQRDADVDTTTKLGRPRIWALGDGKVLRTREEAAYDDRFYYGTRGPLQLVRRPRVVKVQIVRSDPDSLSGAALVLEFFPISGLGFDAAGLRVTEAYPGVTDDYDDNNLYVDRVGYNFGPVGAVITRRLFSDPSSCYCVAPPAWVIKNDGDRPYMHVAAVYGRPSDFASSRVSTPRSLTCHYLDDSGDEQFSTIEFAPYADGPGLYPGVVQTRLIRLAPLSLLLVSGTQPLIEPGVELPSTSLGRGVPVRTHWSTDGGKSWLETGVDAWASTPETVRNGSTELGTVVPLGEGRALIFSRYHRNDDAPPDAGGIHVLLLTPTLVTLTCVIPNSQFSQGLMRPRVLTGKHEFPPYHSATEVGGSCGKFSWAQFEPAWMDVADHEYGIQPDAGGLGFPFERPMLMVTEDGGVTFERRLLPDPFNLRVGFVVALDTKTLAVPVFRPRVRQDNGSMPALRGHIYTSRNAGRTWRRGAPFTLPYYCRADGQLFPDQYVEEYDPLSFNRGELFPLVPLADEAGSAAGISPGSPWLTDSRFKEPKP